MIVHIFEEAAVTAGHRCWKRRVEQDGARVATRQDGARAPMYALAQRARRGISLSGLCQRAIEIAVVMSRRGHTGRPFGGRQRNLPQFLDLCKGQAMRPPWAESGAMATRAVRGSLPTAAAGR